MLIHAYCTVTYNYSTNFLPTGYRFHLIDPDEFIELVATVVGDTFNIKTLLTFTKGRDGGRDAAADCVNIDLGEENILVNQNLVVKVEHSKDESKTIDDDMRRDLFEKDKNNVEELVQKNQLDTYMVVTNYILLTNQSTKLVKFFKNAGIKSVIIVGKGTLSCWLNVSPELESKVIRQYPDLIDQTTVQMLEQYREHLKKQLMLKHSQRQKRSWNLTKVSCLLQVFREAVKRLLQGNWLFTSFVNTIFLILAIQKILLNTGFLMRNKCFSWIILILMMWKSGVNQKTFLKPQ